MNAASPPCRLASEEIHHQFRDQLRLIVLHLVARVGHIVKLDVRQHCFQLSAERHGGKSVILAPDANGRDSKFRQGVTQVEL